MGFANGIVCVIVSWTPCKPLVLFLESAVEIQAYSSIPCYEVRDVQSSKWAVILWIISKGFVGECFEEIDQILLVLSGEHQPGFCGVEQCGVE